MLRSSSILASFAQLNACLHFIYGIYNSMEEWTYIICLK